MSTTTTQIYKSNLSIPFGKLQSVLDWCYRNCLEEWSYKDDSNLSSYNWTQAILSNSHNLDYVFTFHSERDYLAFIMVYE
jgi:hypothetical protein